MVMSSYAVRAQNVTKAFRIHGERNRTLKDKFIYAGRAKFKDFVALDNVSVDIPRGATVGLIGVNGSGKSTLLKLMSRILYPDKGTIEVNGRVSSLLELGAGFHPDFTGLENVFLNGSLMGLSKKELNRKLDAIVDFSELGDFIREPIRGYSSGMYMRLAFSIATAVDPDILLIDEILAVGDAPFQAKCMSRLKELQQANKTIVIVTHDSGTVERFCDTAVWLDSSRVRSYGSPKEVVRGYLSETFVRSHEGGSVMSFDRNKASHENAKAHKAVSETNPGTDCAQIVLKATSGLGEGMVEVGGRLSLNVNILPMKDFKTVTPRIRVSSEDGVNLLEAELFQDENKTVVLSEGLERAFSVDFPNVTLMPGEYNVALELWTDDGEPLDVPEARAKVSVIGEEKAHGYVSLLRVWKI